MGSPWLEPIQQYPGAVGGTTEQAAALPPGPADRSGAPHPSPPSLTFLSVTSDHTDATALPDDGTLGGYLEVHDRPPAFEGPDGYPYTVSVEVERTGDLLAPCLGYLVFPRWASTGVGVVGHVESPTLVRCRTEREVQERLGALTLSEVRKVLEDALARRNDTDNDES